MVWPVLDKSAFTLLGACCAVKHLLQSWQLVQRQRLQQDSCQHLPVPILHNEAYYSHC